MPVRTRRNRDRSAFLPHLRDRLPWRPPSKSGRSIGGGAAAEHSNTVRGPSQEMGRPARYVGWAVVGHSALRRAGRLQTRSNRSEEHTSELQSLMRISYAVFFLK